MLNSFSGLASSNCSIDSHSATELLKIADYYGEEDLKQRCGQQLKVLTTIENFGEVYSVAVQFSAKVIQAARIDFDLHWQLLIANSWSLFCFTGPTGACS